MQTQNPGFGQNFGQNYGQPPTYGQATGYPSAATYNPPPPQPMAQPQYVGVKQGGVSKPAMIVIIAVVVSVVAIIVAIVVAAIVLSNNNGNKKDEECESYQIQCSSDDVCIWEDWECDGLPDCSQGEDEEECGLSCVHGEFDCHDHSQCIADTLVCDQSDDCSDGSDEWSCIQLVEASGSPVLNASIDGTPYPVCSTNYDSSWNDDICDAMGFGTAASSSTISTSSLDDYGGYVIPTAMGTITTNPLDVLNTFDESCSSNEAVTLTCNYDQDGTRSPNIDVRTGHARIIQGYEAAEGAWPWQIGLLEDFYLICGGTLLNDQWVLTAAHCIDYPNRASAYVIRLGSNKNVGDDTHLQQISADLVFVHEDYDENNQFANDIALLRLENAADTTDYVRPVRLPASSSEDPYDHVVCYTSGWGATNHDADEYPSLLQDVKYPLLTDSECNNVGLISDVGGIIDSLQICAGYESGNIAICSGDSGGPLVCRDSRNVWTLEGVTSWGVFDGRENCRTVGVFAEVRQYVTWINNIISNN